MSRGQLEAGPQLEGGPQLQLRLLLSACLSCAFLSFPLTADQISLHSGVHSLEATASPWHVGVHARAHRASQLSVSCV